MKTVVLLCGDLAATGYGLALEELRASLATPDTAVEVTPHLCDDFSCLPGMIARHGAVRAVLGLCSAEYSTAELQARARKAELDPFGLEVVPLGNWCARVHPGPAATKKAGMLLSAALARARAFPGGNPHSGKPRFISRSQKLTRRALFTLAPVEHSPVARVVREQCAAGTGCRLCMKACPLGALSEMDGTVGVNEARCEGCGVCLSVCPRGAIDLPGWSLAQFDAQLAALLGSARSAKSSCGLVFTCQRAAGKLDGLADRGLEYSPGWVPVVTPCLGMVTPGWILQVLAGGAGEVALLSCGAACPFEQGAMIGGRVNFCRQLLDALGQPLDRVRLYDTAHDESLCQALQESSAVANGDGAGAGFDVPRLGSLESTFLAIKALAGSSGTSPKVVLEHPRSPFGAVTLRSASCTGCMACVETCPTGALAGEQVPGKTAISFDALACNGCGLCTDICPEAAGRALSLRRVTDLDSLCRGRTVLYESQMAVCEKCGAAIAPEAMLRRVEVSLSRQEAAGRGVTRLCPDCRVSLAPRSGPFSQPRKEPGVTP